MNKKILPVSLSIVLSSLSPIWAGGFVEGYSPRMDAAPSIISAQNLPLEASGLNGAVLGAQIQGSQDLLNFEDQAGAIQKSPLETIGKTGAPALSDHSSNNRNETASLVQQATLVNSDTHSSLTRSQIAKDSYPSRVIARAVGRRLSFLGSKIKNFGKFFDGVRSASTSRQRAVAAFTQGIRPLPKLKLPKGVKTDDSPIAPDSRHLPETSIKLFNHIAISNERDVNNLLNAPLEANPRNAASIEQALQRLLAQNAFYGVSSGELAVSHANLVEVPGQLPTWYISFHQQKAGRSADGTATMIPVYGASLTFTIHIENGQAVVKGAEGKVFPGIDVLADQKMTDAAIVDGVRRRLKINKNSSRAITFRDREIFYLPGQGQTAGAWHAVSLYKVEGVDALVAADISTGQTFLWDMRLGAATTPANAASGQAQFEARVPTADSDMGNPPTLSQLPLPGVTVRLPDGRDIVADDDGRVSVELADGKPIKVTARLDGARAVINNESGKPLEVEAQLVQGKDGVVVVFNPPADVIVKKLASGVWGKIIRAVKRAISPSYRAQEQAQQEAEKELAQVTAYYSHYVFINWAQAHGIGQKDQLLNKKLTINVNIADECNAYYDPSSDNLNFFLSSARCINTGTLPGVNFHETGHWTHALVAGYASMGLKAMASVDPGLGEGIGDMFATHILQTPLIGEHFFNDPSQSPLPNGALRETTNNYQFNAEDEVHQQGLAFMGTVGYGGAWNSLLSKSLGADKALGILQGLIFPHIYGYATAADVPSALGVIYLAAKSLTNAAVRDVAMKTLGEAAAKHGMTIPAPGQASQTKSQPSA